MAGEYSSPANAKNFWASPGSVWRVRGLARDPYFLQALSDDNLELFRGRRRKKTSDALVAHVHAGGSPILLVEGGPGLGKTTLVNFALNVLHESGSFYVCAYRLEISEHSTRETIAAEILAAMTTTALASEPDHSWNFDARWIEASRMVSDTWQTSGLGGGMSFAGFGATLSRAQILQLAKVVPWETWKALAGNILGAMSSRRHGFVFHLNNIDAVSDEHPEKVQQLFDELRELLTLPGIYTVLCAGTEFRNEVIGSRQRLLDVITPLGPLEELSSDEFLEAVHARYKLYAISETELVPPVEDAALAELYDDFEGDMRNTFTVARSAVIMASLASSEPKTLTKTEILALGSVQWSRALQNLPNVEQEIVRFLLQNETSPTQGAIQRAARASQPGISHATRRLEKKRWINTIKSGTRLSYQLSGYGLLFKRAQDLKLL